MKKSVFVAACALAASVATAPMALAQEAEPADCAAAVTALNRADGAHRDAVASDEKAKAADAADEALEQARKKYQEAQQTAQTKQDAVNQAGERLSQVMDPDGTPNQGAGFDEADVRAAKAALKTAQDELQDANAALKAAKDERAAAKKEADKVDADDARAEADKTDADALKKALDEAKADFDRLCGGEAPPSSTPASSENPAPPATEDPADQVPAVDLDCKDFPLADGRTAQDVLNAIPGDPHGLDADEDRIACEPGQDTAADSSSDFEDNDEVVSVEKVTVPSGGVSTGVGPA